MDSPGSHDEGLIGEGPVPRFYGLRRIRLIVLLLVCGLLAIMVAVGSVMMRKLRERHVARSVQTQVDGAASLFPTLLDHETADLASMIALLSDDPEIRTAWMAKDRNRLLERVGPLFSEMRERSQVTHFYFIDLDQSIFLRAHNPDSYGDPCSHKALVRAMAENDLASGVEVGIYGAFALRVVDPVVVDGQLIGYMELGKEIDRLLPIIKAATGTDLVFLLEKQGLNRDYWETGAKLFSRTAHWDQFEDHVVTGQTVASVPSVIGRYAAQENANGHAGQLFPFQDENGSFVVGFVQITETDGLDVGDIAVIADMNVSAALTKSLTQSMALTYAAIISLLLVGSFFLLGKIEGKLKWAWSRIIEESDKRKKMEQRALDAQKHVESIIESIPDPVMVIDSQHRILLANKVVREMAEQADLDIGAARCHEVLHRQDAPCQGADSGCALSQAMKSGEPVQATHVHPTADGGQVHMEVNASPTYDKDGRFVHLVEVWRDITSRVEAGEERERLIEKLQAALEQVETLRGIIPICSHCKNVRDSEGYWQRVDTYIAEHSEAQFTHSLCEKCIRDFYPEMGPDPLVDGEDE